MRMWPPSSTGTGMRFSRPRFRLIEAISAKSATQPACADSPDNCAMPDRAHQLPQRRFAGDQTPQRLQNQSGELDVALDAEPDGLERAGQERARLVADG